MFKVFARQKFKTEAFTYAHLILYPHGRDLLQNFPGLDRAFAEHFKDKGPPSQSGILAACLVLTNLIERLPATDRAVIAQQLRSTELTKLWEYSRAGTNATFPDNVMVGTIMIGAALVEVKRLVDTKKAEEASYNYFASEVLGAVEGRSHDERLSTLIGNTLQTHGIRRGDDDPLMPASLPAPMPELSGSRISVNLVSTPTGIAMFTADDGRQITERRNLSQEVLLRVPLEFDSYYFVNVRMKHDEICSCIIAGEDMKVFGDMRAFWWSLAAASVRTMDAEANANRMTRTVFGQVFQTARSIWDSAIREAGSIDSLRDLIVPLRNQHYEAIFALKENSNDEATRLGIDIALAMVLATQSEDPKLEAFAYQRLKRFLWMAGEEPQEFYAYN